MKKFPGTVALFVTLLTVTIMVTESTASWHSEHQNAPARVTQLQADQQSDGIQLRWRAVKGCIGYRIYHERGEELLPGSFWIDIYGPQTSYLFTEVVPGERFSFRVSALNGRQEGLMSTQVTVLVKDKTAAGPSDTAK